MLSLTTLALFYAPLTEEPAKWLVLLLPFVRRGLDAESAIPLALAIGVGFGIGELWFIAQQVARVPEYAAVPFYMFTGFLGERFAVCFLHGAFIAYAVRQLAERRSFLLGGLVGIGLHFATNFPIFLISYGFRLIDSAGFLLGCEAVRLACHESRRASHGTCGGSSEHSGTGRAVSWVRGCVLGAASPEHLAVGARPYHCRDGGTDLLCAELDRGTAGPLQRVGAAGAVRRQHS